MERAQQGLAGTQWALSPCLAVGWGLGICRPANAMSFTRVFSFSHSSQRQEKAGLPLRRGTPSPSGADPPQKCGRRGLPGHHSQAFLSGPLRVSLRRMPGSHPGPCGNRGCDTAICSTHRTLQTRPHHPITRMTGEAITVVLALV